MIKKTTNYEMFKFRKDNREKGVDACHLKRMIESIKARNLLEFRPIIVNSDMEVIDGQHRLMAAKELKLPIYYEVDNDSNSKDIILLNVSKTWGYNDYLHYYYKNDYPEYIKMHNFIKKTGLHVWIVFDLAEGIRSEKRKNFRLGTFKFEGEGLDKKIEWCTIIIDKIISLNGNKPFLRTTRFWRALIKIIDYPGFELKRLLENIGRFSSKITSKTNTESYLRLFQEIYNYRTTKKIDLFEDKIYDE